MLVIDSMTGQPIECEEWQIKAAVIHLNLQLKVNGYLSLAEYLEILDRWTCGNKVRKPSLDILYKLGYTKQENEIFRLESALCGDNVVIVLCSQGSIRPLS